jgi:Virus neck protein
MALNPFFLQGAPGEQRLIQDLINEHLKIYGVEVTYIPRKFVRKETILKEVSSSVFDDNFLLEAYVNTYDGYSGAGDILTKFGMSLRDELNIVISKERFEDFISPFIEGSDGIELSTRPREGDLIYFPLGKRLFEVKFVEHEKPFYQLGKTYVYELNCELFEYEDEVIDTSIEEIDTTIQEQGYITTLNLIGYGRTATATSQIGVGYISEIYLNNDGSGYTSPPSVTIDPAPSGGINAIAQAKIRNKGGVYSVDSISLVNAGLGYTTPPKIQIYGGGGVGAAATCSIFKDQKGVISVTINDGGDGYSAPPNVSIIGPPGNGSSGLGVTATAISYINSNNNVSSILLTNTGYGYRFSPTVVIDPPPVLTGFGNYIFNETVTGSISNTKATVKSWDADTKVLKVSFVDLENNGFVPGEVITGSASSARYSVQNYNLMNLYDKYSENNDLEIESREILDFSESNPFGNY